MLILLFFSSRFISIIYRGFFVQLHNVSSMIDYRLFCKQALTLTKTATEKETQMHKFVQMFRLKNCQNITAHALHKKATAHVCVKCFRSFLQLFQRLWIPHESTGTELTKAQLKPSSAETACFLTFPSELLKSKLRTLSERYDFFRLLSAIA